MASSTPYCLESLGLNSLLLQRIILMMSLPGCSWLLTAFISAAFVAPSCGWTVAAVTSTRRHAPPLLLESQVVDVDFKNVDETPSEKQPPTVYADDSDSKTLLDLSLESDTELRDTRIPFVDGENYIDVKLAFMAEMDGLSYGIGVPFEPAAALAFEKGDGSVTCLSPDVDENEEFLQLMAAQLQEHVGEDLRLKRTPRVLTISGPLENYTKNWEENILPDPVDAKTLLGDDSDNDLEFFHSFMKEELGEEEYERTLEESSDDISDEFRSLFDIPGLGTEVDDVRGMEKMVESMLDEPEEQMKRLEELGGPDLDHDGVGLKLVSYILPGGKSYSLVQLLKPFILIGRLVESKDDTRFELLSPEEAPILTPRLEAVCKEDFERFGLTS